MKEKFQRLVAWLMSWVGKCMEAPDVNSRLVFLVHGLVASIGTLFLVVMFAFAKDRTGYEGMVLALGGSGGAAAVGRYLTKKNGGDAAEEKQ